QPLRVPDAVLVHRVGGHAAFSPTAEKWQQGEAILGAAQVFTAPYVFLGRRGLQANRGRVGVRRGGRGATPRGPGPARPRFGIFAYLESLADEGASGRYSTTGCRPQAGHHRTLTV